MSLIRSECSHLPSIVKIISSNTIFPFKCNSKNNLYVFLHLLSLCIALNQDQNLINNNQNIKTQFRFQVSCFLPWLGSVKPKHPMYSPVANFGMNLSLISFDPNSWIGCMTRELWTLKALLYPLSTLSISRLIKPIDRISS